MRNEVKRQPRAATRRGKPGASEDEREKALLAEFTRHESVASLAGAIAGRLGGNVRKEDLVARAGLDSTPAPG
jgi:hypothetical protein